MTIQVSVLVVCVPCKKLTVLISALDFFRSSSDYTVNDYMSNDLHCRLFGDEAMTTDIEAEDMVDRNGNELISLEPLRSLTMDGFGT